MRSSLRAAAALAIAGTIAVGLATPAAADPGTTWTVDLAAADAAGVTVTDGTARLAARPAFRAPAGEGTSDAPPVPTGLLTFAARELPAPTVRVDTVLSGDSAGATVDVRGRRATGAWTEWLPADQKGSVTLPDPTAVVQARLVLTGTSAVTGVTLSASPAGPRTEATPDTEQAPASYKVFATREGLVGGTTANGHVITDNDHFVALPSRRALSPDGSSDYSVKVCAANGRCAFAPVWDVGPWNTRDDYWNTQDAREDWTDLPQGRPQAQAAFSDGYNDGKDQFDRQVLNPAGIDLGDGVFWDALGLDDNGWVTVDYLWTGSERLSKVVGDAPAKVLAAPDIGAAVVGVAAEGAAVPVLCRSSSPVGAFLQIGIGQYLDAAAVLDASAVTPCPATSSSSTRAPSG